MSAQDDQYTWATYSDLWRTFALPRGLLDEWVIDGRVRQIATAANNIASYPFLSGKPFGAYYCVEDLEGLWEDERIRDAVIRLGGDAAPRPNPRGRPQAGPYGWPLKGR